MCPEFESRGTRHNALKVSWVSLFLKVNIPRWHLMFCLVWVHILLTVEETHPPCRDFTTVNGRDLTSTRQIRLLIIVVKRSQRWTTFDDIISSVHLRFEKLMDDLYTCMTSLKSSWMHTFWLLWNHERQEKESLKRCWFPGLYSTVNKSRSWGVWMQGLTV